MNDIKFHQIFLIEILLFIFKFHLFLCFIINNIIQRINKIIMFILALENLLHIFYNFTIIDIIFSSI